MFGQAVTEASVDTFPDRTFRNFRAPISACLRFSATQNSDGSWSSRKLKCSIRRAMPCNYNPLISSLFSEIGCRFSHNHLPGLGMPGQKHPWRRRGWLLCQGIHSGHDHWYDWQRWVYYMNVRECVCLSLYLFFLGQVLKTSKLTQEWFYWHWNLEREIFLLIAEFPLEVEQITSKKLKND